MRYTVKQLMHFLIVMIILILLIPPYFINNSSYVKASTPQDLARKQLVTFGLCSDILFDIIWLIPITASYIKPKLLLQMKWQYSFIEKIRSTDKYRQFLFLFLYFTNDGFGAIFQHFGLFKSIIISEAEIN